MSAGPNGRIRCVGGIVGDSSGRLLLIRRANDPGRGQWSLPGGRVESGEADDVALVRELQEETGLTVIVGDLIGVVERKGPKGVYVIYDYACSVTGGDLQAGDDALEAAWVDLATFTTLDAGNDLVEQLSDTLRGWGVLPR
ncbi:NUDIX hydrolase [Actinokineospora xionganensis]|uniref:NUDIX domain-containing protein n=1 Tax=Actinokineospora xionganensis TaxID=2684470 RepID=A0ABR7LCE7_9PSEU|nr:NUDIX domain-containing protein [Actinokineospora xionganensis]MBC6450389.1 NUDIX domain-containing protein [Actinokineospora xionganensis]